MLTPPPPPPPSPITVTIEIKAVAGVPRFVGPATAPAGATLRVVNRADPGRFGPHTFSLVAPEVLPRSALARRTCFSPEGICRKIANWHGVKGNGAPARSLATAGGEGWDTAGDLLSRGDSWYSGYRRGASVEQPLTVAAPATIRFVCAIHPRMQGSLRVQAPWATS